MVDERVSGLDEEGEMSEFVADNGVLLAMRWSVGGLVKLSQVLRGCRSSRSGVELGRNSGVELGRKWRLNPWNLARSE